MLRGTERSLSCLPKVRNECNIIARGKISEITINPGIFVKIMLTRKKKKSEIMIDPTFPETCDVLIDVVRLFSGDIIAFPYCCVKYSGSFRDVKCSS